MPPSSRIDRPLHRAELLRRRRLSQRVFELRLSRPPTFSFKPGQRIRLHRDELDRDYSLASSPADPVLELCIRNVPGGRMSAFLADAAPGTLLDFSGPHGYFVFLPSPRRAVFVATGTGIAPFVSMVRSGIRGFILLHGVRTREDLGYRSLLEPAARVYVGCLSGKGSRVEDPAVHRGRVTDYLESRLDPGDYDFYLCGRSDMIRDATRLVDDRFPGSRVYTETFY